MLPSRPRPELAEEVTQARGKDLRVLSALCFCQARGQGRAIWAPYEAPHQNIPPPRVRQWGGDSRDMGLEAKCPQ